MDNKFTADEIREAIAAARIFNPDYGQEQFQASRELERRLEESGYLGAVCAVARLEKEKGVHCTETLDACQQLSQEKVELEQRVADSRATQKMVDDKVRQAQDRLHQLEEATKQAKAEREREEKALTAFRKKSEKEKGRIEQELEKCRQEADVTKEETATAGQLEVEVGKHGFGLDLALGLAQEFAGYEDIRDKLAEGLKRGLTLTKCNEEAAEQNETLQSDKKSLAGECQQLGRNLSQLRADEAFEKELRRFYHRYQSVSSLVEYLATWRDIFFVRCGNPTYAATSVLNRSTRGARFLTEKPPIRRCPCCDYPGAFYDEELYQALNWKPGDPFQLKLGE